MQFIQCWNSPAPFFSQNHSISIFFNMHAYFYIYTRLCNIQTTFQESTNYSVMDTDMRQNALANKKQTCEKLWSDNKTKSMCDD